VRDACRERDRLDHAGFRTEAEDDEQGLLFVFEADAQRDRAVVSGVERVGRAHVPRLQLGRRVRCQTQCGFVA
jgi:hypothetical protein